MLKIRNTMHRFETNEGGEKNIENFMSPKELKRKKGVKSKKERGNSKQTTQIRW